LNVRASPYLEQYATLQLDRVEIIKESKPVMRLMKVPTINAIAAVGPRSVRNQRRKKAMIAKMRQRRYSYLMNSNEA